MNVCVQHHNVYKVVMSLIIFHVSVSQTPLDPSDIDYYWNNSMLRVLCTGFNCQITTESVEDFRKENPPYRRARNERYRACGLLACNFRFLYHQQCLQSYQNAF